AVAPRCPAAHVAGRVVERTVARGGPGLPRSARPAGAPWRRSDAAAWDLLRRDCGLRGVRSRQARRIVRLGAAPWPALGVVHVDDLEVGGTVQADDLVRVSIAIVLIAAIWSTRHGDDQVTTSR